MTLYTKVVDADGNVTFQEASTVPDELVRNHPVFKDVLEESISRRKRAQDAEAERDQLRAKVQAPTVAEVPTSVEPLDREALYKEIAERIRKEDSERNRAETERRSKLQGLMATHKLKEDAFVILEKSTDPDAVAELLGRSALRFEDTNSGQTPNADPITDMLGRVKNNLGLKE